MGFLTRWRERGTRDDVGAVPVIPAIPAEQVYHDAAQYRLGIQVTSSDTLDNKVTQALTIGGAALPLTFALVTASRGVDAVLRLEQSLSVAFVVALVSYGAIGLVYFIVGCLGPRGLSVRPEMQNFQKVLPNYIDDPMGGRVLKQWVGDEYVRSIERNRGYLRWKAGMVFLAQAALVVEIGALAWGTIRTLT